jgi:hypothetical protein
MKACRQFLYFADLLCKDFKKDRIGLKECRERKYWHNPKQTWRYVHDVWNKERRHRERKQKHDSVLPLKGISIRHSGKAFVLFSGNRN